MCGLFGCASYKNGIEPYLRDARSARDVLLHRGPDQAGEWFDPNVYLGHRRLSILDLSDAGRQPMTADHDDVVITVNGEIYNFKELRLELEEKGFSFKSGSDSEVVLHGYAAWGIEALLDKIDGMYAICIYDRVKGQIFLARDRAGIKPLYYAQINGSFAWASELKALRSFYKPENLSVDNTALYDFLTYRYIPAPKTAYQQIFKLPPAHVLHFDVKTGLYDIQSYWRLPFANGHATDEQWAYETRRLVAQSVREQMVADVPVGFFLSGGIDSSIIAAHATDQGHEVHSFTIGFGVKEHDETHYAEIVAHAIKSKHHTKIITPHLDKPFPEWLLDMYDEPFADNSALPTWYVARFARENATVALSGDGGDELFGGYRWYRLMPWVSKIHRIMQRLPARFWAWFPSERLRYALMSISGNADILAVYNDLFHTRSSLADRAHFRRVLQIPEGYDDMWFFRQFWHPDKMSFRKALQYLDFHTFMPEDVLTKVDRATMDHALEARVPFLSRHLIEFAFQLPESFIYRNGQLKGGLKQAHKDMIPAEIISRSKKGFSLPWKYWKKELVGSQNSLTVAVLHAFRKGFSDAR